MFKFMEIDQDNLQFPDLSPEANEDIIELVMNSFGYTEGS